MCPQLCFGIVIAIEVLAVVAALHLLVKLKKEGIGGIVKILGWLPVIIGFLIMICTVAGGFRHMCSKKDGNCGPNGKMEKCIMKMHGGPGMMGGCGPMEGCEGMGGPGMCKMGHPGCCKMDMECKGDSAKCKMDSKECKEMEKGCSMSKKDSTAKKTELKK